MADKRIIVVGAGIGGLAAGCYARMNGYDVRIYEKHSLPGGVCTGWRRRGYTFDGCIHHLAGCLPGSKVYRMWQELGAMPRSVYYPDDLIAVEAADGRRFTVYTDLDRLEQHMLELAPADAATTREFVAAARRITRFSLMDMVLAGPLDMVRMLPNIPLLGKWGKPTLEQYAARFSDPFLRRAFPMINYDFPNIPTIVALMFLSGCATRYLGWPAGGGLELARSIARRFCALGGEIHYNSAVSQVLTEGGKRGDRAVGIRLADGSEDRADVVISNADGHATIFEMLGGRYTTELIRSYYSQAPAEQVMGTHVSIGVARDLSVEPHALVLWLPEPIEIGGQAHDRLDLELYHFAPEMAPAGKTVVKALFPARYAPWQDLHSRPDDYAAEKQRVADMVVEQLERRFPGFKGQVETVDVATPMTTERYAGSFHGLQAWAVPNQSMLDALSGKGISQALPGLANFYMVGQWAGGLGLPNVAAMGRKTIRALCKHDGRRFVTSIGQGSAEADRSGHVPAAG